MKIGKVLGVVGSVAATVAAAKVDPSLGVAVGGGLLGGAGGKLLGKRAEEFTGRRVHKASGPLGAIAVSALALLVLAKTAGIDTAALCGLIEQACQVMSHGDAASLLLLALTGGGGAITLQSLTRGVPPSK